MTSNPTWDDDERALALELYLRRGSALSKKDPEVLMLSRLLNDRARAKGMVVADDFRNAAGVALKLANFAALDPTHPGKGMTRGSKGDAATWDGFAGDTDLLALRVDEIMRGLKATPLSKVPLLLELEDDSTAEYEFTIDAAVRTAYRREAQLVQRFGAFLRSNGRMVGSHHHRAGASTLRIDLVDETTQRIWEAKAEVGRNAVRLAIGQLADYRRFEAPDWTTGVLMPRRPNNDLLDLCASVGAAAAWPTPQFESFVVLDPCA